MQSVYTSRSADTAERLAKVADEFLQAVERGQSPTVEEYAERYPEIAAILRDVLPAMTLLKPSLSGESNGHAEEQLIDRILGDFRLIREIGRGGMGVVYEAEQLSLGRQVALKVLPFAAMLDPRQLTRFRNEARAAASLHHNNIVPVFSVGCERSVHFYAMQFIEGESLAHILDQLRSLKGLPPTDSPAHSMAKGNSESAAARQRLLSLSYYLTSGQLGQPPVNSAASDPTAALELRDRGGKPPVAFAPRSAGLGGRGQEAGDRSQESARQGSGGQGSGGRSGESTDSPVHPFTPSPAHSPHDTSPEVQAFLSTARSSQSRNYFRNIAELGIQAGEALDHAHEQGVIHRDIKPANLLLDGTGRLWITDFGLARLEADAGMTMTGDLVGTLRYMSPEQALAKRVVVDHRTDIYSLGATLYELLTLQPVFDGDDRQSLLRQISFDEPKGLRKVNRHIPAELETIVLKALRKNPAERYATAKDLADDLRRFIDHKPIKAKPPTWRERAAKWSRRHPAAIRATLMAAMASAIAIGASIGWVARDQASRQAALSDQIIQALEETASYYQSRKITAAASSLKRAESLLANSGQSDELSRRVGQWHTDLDAVKQLEQIRLDQALPAISRKEAAANKDGNDKKVGGHNNLPRDWESKWDIARAARGYREVFQRYGIDEQAIDVNSAAQRIRKSSIKLDLIAALDDWYQITASSNTTTDGTPKKHNSGNQALLEIARSADSDAWRNQLRDAIWDDNFLGLRKLANETDAATQPLPTVLLLARALMARSANFESPEAARILRQVQRRNPGDFWVNVELANCVAQLPITEELAYRRIAIALRPDSPGAYCALGDTLICLNDFAQAELAYTAATDQSPDYAPAYLGLGVALHNQGKHIEAEAAFRKAIELEPDYSDAHVKLGNVLRDQKKSSEAESVQRKAVALAPNTSEAHRGLADSLSAQRKYADAEESLRKAIQLNPNDGMAHNHLGLLLDEQGRFEEAAIEHHAYIRLETILERPHVGHFNLARDLAREAKKTGQPELWDQAAAEFTLTIDVIADNPPLADERDAICCALSSWTEVFNRVIKLRPKDPQLWCGRGTVFFNRKKWAQSESAFREACRLNPTDPSLHRLLAKALARLAESQVGDAGWDEAASEYLRAVDLSADSPFIFAPRKEICHELCGWDNIYERVAALRPNEPALWIGKGRHNTMHSKWKEAAEAYSKVIHDRFLSAETVEYAYLLAQLGDREAYRRFCQELVARHDAFKDDFEKIIIAWACAAGPDCGVDRARIVELAEQGNTDIGRRHALGLAQYRNGQFEAAIQNNSGYESPSTAIHMLLVCAMAYHQLGDKAKAAQCMETARPLIAVEMAKKPDDPTHMFVSYWTSMHSLLREAETLLAATPASDIPDSPQAREAEQPKSKSIMQ